MEEWRKGRWREMEGQRVLVAPRGEGPEQLTSVCVCVWGKWECVRERLAELVLLPPREF